MVSLVAGAACGPEPIEGDALDATFRQIVTERASIEFPCPASELTVEPLGGEAYRVVGCGGLATYECAYSTAVGVNTNQWLYVCDRAAHDLPTPLDAGSD